MKKILFFFLCLLSVNYCVSQNISFIGGINYGGPLPTHNGDSMAGHPVPGMNVGLSLNFNINERLSLLSELYYSFRGADYSECYTHDTTVTIIILGVSGQVPSFYTAYVNGAMRLHYIDFPVMLSYRTGKIKMMAGSYLSYLAKCKDVGNVRIVIGEGGFYDDYTEYFNNKNILRKWDWGVKIGINLPVYQKLGAEFKISRSFNQLYIPGSMDGKINVEKKLYHTFLHASITYLLF